MIVYGVSMHVVIPVRFVLHIFSPLLCRCEPKPAEHVGTEHKQAESGHTYGQTERGC